MVICGKDKEHSTAGTPTQYMMASGLSGKTSHKQEPALHFSLVHAVPDSATLMQVFTAYVYLPIFLLEV